MEAADSLCDAKRTGAAQSVNPTVPIGFEEGPSG